MSVTIGAVKRTGLPHPNPQTQEQLVKSQASVEKPGNGPKAKKAAVRKRGTVIRKNKGRYAKGKATTKEATANAAVLDHFATD